MKKQTIIESIIWIVLIFTILFVYSCGTRKTDISKTETSQSDINIENTYSMGSKIVLIDLFTAKPIDALKPMWIDGKEYRNAEISNDKSKIETEYLKVKETKYIHTSREIIKYKTTIKTNYDFLWLGMFLIFVSAVFAWFYLPKIK